jgi:hypothetical protein
VARCPGAISRQKLRSTAMPEKSHLDNQKYKIKDITTAMMWNQPYVAKRIDHIPRSQFENKNILFLFLL